MLASRSGLHEEFQNLILWLKKIDPEIEEANEDYLFEVGRMVRHDNEKKFREMVARLRTYVYCTYSKKH
jgi:hypothetical protein